MTNESDRQKKDRPYPLREGYRPSREGDAQGGYKPTKTKPTKIEKPSETKPKPPKNK